MPDNIKLLVLTNFKFHFALGSGDCYRLRTGQCSLDFPFRGDEAPKYVHGESSFEYCRNLYLFMKENQMDPSILHARKCGHYEFTDGQHRACIAKRTGLLAAVTIDRGYDGECRHCYFKSHSLIYRIKSALGITFEFTDEKQMIKVQNIGRRLMSRFGAREFF